MRIVVGVSLASLAAAVALPPNGFKRASPPDRSSVRKSLNFGPSVPSAHLTGDDFLLAAYNAALPSLSTTAAESCPHDLSGLSDRACVAKAIVKAFANSRGDFRLVDAYVSKRSGLLHAYFVQTVQGLDVANANLNVNYDIEENKIVSFADSSAHLDINETVAKSFTLDREWNPAVENVGEQVPLIEQPAIDILAEYTSPPLIPSSEKKMQLIPTDPRRGLVSFLALQAPSADLSIFFTDNREVLIDSIVSEPRQLSSPIGSTISLSSKSFMLLDVPSAVQPVSAELTYVNDGDMLRLAWKYVLETASNHYEAYVSADADAVARNGDETILVVDWVRDFRPTGGEIGSFDGSTLVVLSSNEAESSIDAAPRKIRIGSVMPHFVANRARPHTDSRPSIDTPKSTTKPSYRVFPWGVNAPDEGRRELLTGSLVELDEEASPAGWHSVPGQWSADGLVKSADVFYDDTRGNNVIAQENWEGANNYENNLRPSAGKNMSFDFPLGWRKGEKKHEDVDPKTYINASVTELFYTNNEIHDLFYRYGFDEVAGNFQETNFGRGGKGGDAVQANAQDGSGYNNANFATPPDGQRPRMRMYTWTATQPYRDGDLESGIVTHEYSHGISTRLTGGPANSGCLGFGEAGGMGEGWGDFFATMIRMHSTNVTDYSMGEWASGRVGGIRNYRYSLNMTINPDTYKKLDAPGYWGVHAIGEVWAEMLFEVAELLIVKHGFTNSLFPPPANADDSAQQAFFHKHPKTGKIVPKHGNTLIVQLVVDGMKLQPCRPSFNDARDAILQADHTLTGGENACEIWKGFSKRGLGPGSKLVGGTPWGGGIHSEDFELPAKCQSKH